MDSWHYVQDSEFRPNRVMDSGQTVDMIMQLVGPMVKKLVREEVRDHYDQHLSDLERRLSELEAKFHDLEALVIKGSKRNGSRNAHESSTTKVEKHRTEVNIEHVMLHQHQQQSLHRTRDLNAPYRDLQVQIDGLDKNSSSVFSTISSYMSETDRTPRASEHRPSSGHSSSSFTFDCTTPPPINRSPPVEHELPRFRAPPSSHPTSSSHVAKDDFVDRSFGTVTKKHQRFIGNPAARYKPVTTLAGIGKTYGERLERAGYATAETVLQKYQDLDYNEQRFKAWLKETCNASELHQNQCYQCIRQWESQN